MKKNAEFKLTVEAYYWLKKFKTERFRKIFVHQKLPAFLADCVLVFVSLYTFTLFHNDPEVYANFNGFVFYFLPSIFITIFLLIAIRHRLIGGVMFVLLSYGLFFPYKTNIGLMVSAALFISGILFMTDEFKKIKVKGGQ